MTSTETTTLPVTPEQVFRDYAPRIYNLARRMVNNDADAEDVTQNVLVQVLRNLHTFRGESSITTWLHNITVNAALALRAQRAKRAEHEIALAENGRHGTLTADPPGNVRLRTPHPHHSPDDIVLADEQRELIDTAIQKLPEAYRDVYVLVDVEGLPKAEVAEMLGLTVPNVKSRLHRARLEMRHLLAPHFEEEAR
jgi:RNA polymerase sigma-70 factor, ECF subfamily